MILHAKCLRALISVLKDYVENDKLDEFIDRLLEVSGTNSSFKIVFKEIKQQLGKVGNQLNITDKQL